MSWGLSPWGLHPYGLGTSVPFSVLSVEARAELVVRVSLTRAALAQQSTGVGDALNPRTWLIVDENGFAFTVLSVREISLATAFELYLLQKLGPSGISHTLHAPFLKDTQGGAITVSEMDFDGLQAAAFSAGARSTQVDFAKSADNFFQFGAGGDYEVHAGNSLLKKLFYRRLSTSPGGFFHLADYGLGIGLKEPLNAARLVQLKVEVQKQLQLEPEVEQVAASVRLDANGVLLIMVSAKIAATGTEIKETFIPRVVST